MAKCFSLEFKQQTFDYPLSNSHESIVTIVQKLGIGYSTLDKQFRETNLAGSSKHQLSPEQHHLGFREEVKQLREATNIFKKVHVYFKSRSSQEQYTVIRDGTPINVACQSLWSAHLDIIPIVIGKLECSRTDFKTVCQKHYA